MHTAFWVRCACARSPLRPEACVRAERERKSARARLTWSRQLTFSVGYTTLLQRAQYDAILFLKKFPEFPTAHSVSARACAPVGVCEYARVCVSARERSALVPGGGAGAGANRGKKKVDRTCMSRARSVTSRAVESLARALAEAEAEAEERREKRGERERGRKRGSQLRPNLRVYPRSDLRLSAPLPPPLSPISAPQSTAASTEMLQAVRTWVLPAQGGEDGDEDGPVVEGTAAGDEDGAGTAATAAAGTTRVLRSTRARTTAAAQTARGHHGSQQHHQQNGHATQAGGRVGRKGTQAARWPWLLLWPSAPPRRRKTLVLDLDETLIHSTMTSPPLVYDTTVEVMIDTLPNLFYVARRPHAGYFLSEVRVRQEGLGTRAEFGVRGSGFGVRD